MKPRTDAYDDEKIFFALRRQGAVSFMIISRLRLSLAGESMRIADENDYQSKGISIS